MRSTSFRTAAALAVATATLSVSSLASAGDYVSSCEPSVVLAAATGGRKIIIERAIQYWKLHPNYSQSECVDINNGDKKSTPDAECTAPTWWRTDCSGFVSQAWDLAKSYNTSGFSDGGEDSHGNKWVKKSYADLEPGDASNNPGDHIVLFTGWKNAAHTSFCILEESEPGADDAWGGLGAIASSMSVSYGESNGFIPIGLVKLPNVAPTGKLEEASCDGITGWAQDVDTSAAAIEVDLYAEAAEGKAGSMLLGTVKADVVREDLCKPLGSCAHGFSLDLPADLRDGAAHPIYAYAHDNDASAPKVLLGGSPLAVTCAPAVLGDPPKPQPGDPTSGSGGGTGSSGGSGGGSAKPATPDTAANGDDPADASSCSVSAPSRGGMSSLGLLAMIGCALTLARRRRR